ncbi:MAG: CoA transferase [Chloroflexi bacterium]|nr:CoA transferase [Chloroflexota bacterium]MCY3589193.1 CoA transferase [Chloroflexota bacterium]MCY3687328.1 CoA transferase [Chloroflexota bacterium]MDE2709561.1 CoA transferase [Chloroflexota bacterium]
MASSDLPLSGSVVIDLSDECLCLGARWLSDFGADVIRIESSSGDQLRIDGPHLDDRADVESGLRHLLYNAGKRSLALNFDAPGAWDLIERLLDAADVVLAPLDKSVEARRFFNRARLQRIHPHLGVIDVVTRRGGEGLPASDIVGVAAGGLMQGLGFPDVAPDYPAGKLAYKQASQIAAATATAMLYDRRNGVRASHAYVSLQEAILSTTIHFANENMWRQLGEKAFRPGGNISSLVQSRDGKWLTLGITPNTHARWAAFGQWLHERAGYDGIIGAEYPGDIYIPEWGGETHQALQRACASLDRDELCYEGQSRGFLAVPVNSARDIVEDPHLHERGAFLSVEHPQFDRQIDLPRLPIHSTGYEPVGRPAPELGADSADVLSELLDFEASEYDELVESGMVTGRNRRATAAARTPSAASRQLPPEGGANGTQPRQSLHRDDLPLKGIRVIDFCWQAAGPLTTELMANLGADVIKIESDARIDTLRVALPAYEPPTIETGAFFQDCNTDKRSINLNLGAPDGLRVAYDLIREADVVTDNFTGGVMKRLGLGFDVLKKINPRIVVCSLPVMGTWGPKASWKGIGNSVVALCGLAAHTGAADRKPTGVLLHTDFTLGPLAATAILSALIQRDRTGVGQEIEIPQYEAGIHLLDTELIEQLANGTLTERRGNRSPEMAPHGLFRCAGDDRWLALCARNTVDWLEVCHVIDREDLASRDDLRSLAGRQAAEDEIEAAISEWTCTQDVWQATQRFVEAGVPAGPNEDIEDLVETDPSMTGFFHEFDHPVGIKFMAQNQPFLWNGQRLPIHRAPFFGEHNEQVYRQELGLSQDEFTRLLVDEVIR